MQWHAGTGIAGRQAGLSISEWKIFMSWLDGAGPEEQAVCRRHALHSSCEGDDYWIGETRSAGPLNIALSEVPSENPDDKGVW